MTRLSERKTKLSFVTDAEVLYRGRMRRVVVEAHDGFTPWCLGEGQVRVFEDRGGVRVPVGYRPCDCVEEE